MTTIMADGPLFALVDDHIHAARLMSRTMVRGQVPARLSWLGNGDRARRILPLRLETASPHTPDMIIVDLKIHSGATAAFIAEIGNLARTAGVPIAAITADKNPRTIDHLRQCGASAVFERHHDLTAYRAEIARLTDFWVRETLTWPIRA